MNVIFNLFKRYVETVRQIESRRNARYMAFDIKKSEYVCPLCETLGNTVMPVFPDLNSLTSGAQEPIPIEISFEDWLDGLEKTLENSVKKELHDDKGKGHF